MLVFAIIQWLVLSKLKGGCCIVNTNTVLEQYLAPDLPISSFLVVAQTKQTSRLRQVIYARHCVQSVLFHCGYC